MTQYITLTQGQRAAVDDGDFPWLNQWEWCLVSGKYAGRAIPDPSGRHRQQFIFMHKAVLGAPSGQRVDHINGNKLDNRRDNLRLATSAQNTHNRCKLSRNKFGKQPTSKYKGVHWRRARKRWEVLVYAQGKQIYVGRFRREQEIDAARAYDEAARKYQGPFARTNFGPHADDHCPKD